MPISYTGSTLSIAPLSDMPLFLITQKLKHLAENLEMELLDKEHPLLSDLLLLLFKTQEVNRFEC